MAKTYEHTFADLHGQDDGPAPSVVDLGADTQQTDQTGAKINDAPGNPDAGKADQFGDIVPAPKAGADVDDGIDVALGEGEDTDQVATDDADSGDEDDLRGYSKSVRERIARERRMREEAEERSRRTEAELSLISRKVDLQGKETEWTQADEKDNESLADLRTKKVKALEEGQTEAAVDLDDKITDVKANKRARDAERTKAREDAKKAPVAEARKAGNNPKADAWITKNQRLWDNDPLFKKATLAADQLLWAKGLNAQSDQYYVELTKVLADKFDVDKSYLTRGKTNRNGAGGMGSNGVRGGNSGGSINRGQGGRLSVTITREDKQLLASMGQDPDDPRVLKAYAREKVALERAEKQKRDER